MTPNPWVSPVELLTLGALFTSEAWTTVAVAREHVAVTSQRMLWVTVAGYAALALAVVPVVRGALVAVVSVHVLPAGTPSCLRVALALTVITG